eukprot:scaffold144748_cov33-Tisochrysis_lutea.AAC.2
MLALLGERRLDQLKHVEDSKRLALARDGHVAIAAVLELMERLEHGGRGLHTVGVARHDCVDCVCWITVFGHRAE